MIQRKSKPKVGISIGDINGVGPEVILKTFRDPRIYNYCTPVVFVCKNLVSYYIKMFELTDINYSVTKDMSFLKQKYLNLYCNWHKELDININVGQSTDIGGKHAYRSLETAIEALKNKKIDVLVTAPINKKNIQSDEFKYPGHTEFLRDVFGVESTLMLMVSEELKVAQQTGHISLNEVPGNITKDGILKNLRILKDSLQNDFIIRQPKIAVLALNPHASDSGLIGDEEEKCIIPAIEEAKNEGILAFGPYPADGFFGNHLYRKYDAVLAMYHDQGLIPFKSLGFENGVNYTAGLPVVRTSPVHGTGYNIAGQNIADETSFRSAVFTALKILANRNMQNELSQNPLKSKIVREKEE